MRIFLRKIAQSKCLLQQQEPFRHRVKKIVFPSSGERVVFVIGRDKIAREDTTAYTMVHQRSVGLSPNTMYLQMQAVAMMLDWADARGIDLEQRIGSGDLLSNDEIYALRDHLRSRADNASGVVGGQHYRNRCVSVRDYVVWHAESVISRIPQPQWQRAQGHRMRLESFEKLMSSGLPSPAARNREGHSEDVQKLFLEAIHPDSPLNPFKPKFRKRNYALLLLYHERGLRRADALKLTGEDLLLHGDKPYVFVRFRNDDPRDPRVDEPRLKTQPRDLPISNELRAALRDWVMDRAKNFPKAKRTPYIFVAGNGQPLALKAVNQMFQLLRARVIGLPADLTTHHKRHDANDRLTEMSKTQGWSEAQEKTYRNYLMGWTKMSNQGEKYTKRSTREGAERALQALQAKSRGGAE
jgi:integrase